MKKSFRISLIFFLITFSLVGFLLFYKLGSIPSDVEELAQMYSGFLVLGKTNKKIPGMGTPMDIVKANPYLSTLAPNVQAAYHIHPFSSPLQFLTFITTYRLFNVSGKIVRAAQLYSTDPQVIKDYVFSKLHISRLTEETARAYYLISSKTPIPDFASTFNSVFVLCAALGLLTVITTYFLAKKAYGNKEALLSSLLLVTSYSFLIEIRGAWLQHTLSLFTSTLAIYLFYLIHKEKKWRYVFYCALSLMLVGASGYNGPILLPVIFISFMLLNFGYRKHGIGFGLIVSSFLMMLALGWKAIFLVFLILVLPNPKLGFKDIANNISGWFKFQISPLLKDGKLVGLRKYLVLVLVGGVLYYLFTTSFSLHYGYSRNEVMDAMIKFPQGTRGLTPMGQWNYKSEANLNLRFLVKTMFYKMLRPRETFYTTSIYRAGITHYTQVMPGRPMIAPFVTIFCLVGLWALRKKRTIADNIVLPWAIMPFLVYGLYLGYQPRYLLLAIPGLCLLAARGFFLLSKKLSSLKIGKFANLLLGVFVLITVYFQLNTYFGYYRENDGFLSGNYGQHEAAKYLMQHGFPEKQMVVLGHKSLVGYDNFYFNTAGAPYLIKYWDDLLAELAGLDGKHDVGAMAKKLALWESEALKAKEKIFYIFSVGPHFFEMPGEYNPGQIDLETFKYLHYGLAPQKTIYHANGVVALEIYIVDKNTPLNKVVTKEVPERGRYDFVSSGNVSGLVLSGKDIEKMGLSFGYAGLDRETAKLNTFLNTSVLKLGFGGEADIIFSPYASDLWDDAYLAVFNERVNVGFQPNPPPAFGYCFGKVETSNDSKLAYFVNSPYPIENMSIESSLRIYNDKKEQNKLFSYYSVDGGDKKLLFNIVGNGGSRFDYGVMDNTRWSAWRTEETYNLINPKSKQIVLTYQFNGNPGGVLLCPPIKISAKLFVDGLVTKDKIQRIRINNPTDHPITAVFIE